MAAKSRTKSSFEAFYKQIQNILDNELSEELQMKIYPIMEQWFEEQNHLLIKMYKNRKRLVAINFDTIFDTILKNILILYFSQVDKAVKKLFDPSIGGPLVSLTHKARLAYALGLIDKTALNDFEHTHKIRNEFAHSMEIISFADAKVVRHVQKLSTAKDHKITTAKNSFKIYDSATHVCVDGLSNALEQTYNQLDARDKAKKAKKA